MTVAEWVTCREPEVMLQFLWGRWSDRKLRLFLVACARLAWDQMPTDEPREAVVVGERFADGAASNDDRQRMSEKLWSIIADYRLETGQNWFAARTPEEVSAYRLAQLSVHRPSGDSLINRPSWQDGRRTTGDQQPDLLREVFGNPFRPVSVDPAWLTSDVTALAGGIYDERAFDRLPILADALQDAGCDCDELLNHLRDPNATHVRGCWALDLVLGKS